MHEMLEGQHGAATGATVVQPTITATTPVTVAAPTMQQAGIETVQAPKRPFAPQTYTGSPPQTPPYTGGIKGGKVLAIGIAVVLVLLLVGGWWAIGSGNNGTVAVVEATNTPEPPTKTPVPPTDIPKPTIKRSTNTPTVQPVPTQPVPAQPVPVTGNTAVQIIPPNTPLESNNWLYDFNLQLTAPGSPAAVWYGNLDALQPIRGRFVTVLIMVANRTGQDQPLPADFLALKDSNGTVYNAVPEASTAYVIPGENADAGHEQPLPANGIATSVIVVFDVPIGASQLVLYAPSKPDQGWLVLDTVN